MGLSSLLPHPERELQYILDVPLGHRSGRAFEVILHLGNCRQGTERGQLLHADKGERSWAYETLRRLPSAGVQVQIISSGP